MIKYNSNLKEFEIYAAHEAGLWVDGDNFTNLDTEPVVLKDRSIIQVELLHSFDEVCF